MKRRSELFPLVRGLSPVSVGRVPKHLLRQERDWTCALACVRTALTCFLDAPPSEGALIERGGFRPGPLFSDDLMKLLKTEEWELRCGCDAPEAELGDVIALLDEGYSVMLESMYNYSHWMVLLGYFALGSGELAETDRLLCYDPYYHEVRLLNADEFSGMWLDGNHAKNGVRGDYLALRPARG